MWSQEHFQPLFLISCILSNSTASEETLSQEWALTARRSPSLSSTTMLWITPWRTSTLHSIPSRSRILRQLFRCWIGLREWNHPPSWWRAQRRPRNIRWIRRRTRGLTGWASTNSSLAMLLLCLRSKLTGRFTRDSWKKMTLNQRTHSSTLWNRGHRLLSRRKQWEYYNRNESPWDHSSQRLSSSTWQRIHPLSNLGSLYSQRRVAK